MEELQIKKPKIHLFLCTNDRSLKDDPRPSCGPKISKETFKEVKEWIKEKGLVDEVRINRTHCLGFCNAKGGVGVITPSMKYIVGLESAKDIIELIEKELNKF